MNERELDAEVAEKVVGLVRCQAGGHAATDYCHAHPDSPGMGGETRCYSTDISAAMQAEDRVAEMGLQNDYIAALWDVIGLERDSHFWTENNFNALWRCIHATARQRCEAALTAVKGATT